MPSKSEDYHEARSEEHRRLTGPVRICAVRVNFMDCDAGWIPFHVSAGKRRIRVSASHVYDPFSDLLNWLEAIVVGVQRCSFRVDEEGSYMEFEHERRWRPAGSAWFALRDPLNTKVPSMRAVVNTRQMVRAFYEGVRSFAASDKYRPEQWEIETLWDRCGATWPDRTRTACVQWLSRMPSGALAHLFFKLAPSYHIDCTEDPERFRRWIDDVVSGRDWAGGDEIPTEWHIDAAYDGWAADKRRTYLDDYLGNQVNAWSAFPLGRWRSHAVEDYLRSEPTKREDSDLPL